MLGPSADFGKKVLDMFERVQMNELEKGMLEHHLKDFANLPE